MPKFAATVPITLPVAIDVNFIALGCTFFVEERLLLSTIFKQA